MVDGLEHVVFQEFKAHAIVGFSELSVGKRALVGDAGRGRGP